MAQSVPPWSRRAESDAEPDLGHHAEPPESRLQQRDQAGAMPLELEPEPEPGDPSLRARVKRLLHEELRQLRPWESLVLAFASRIPRYALGYTRTMILRTAGLRIGEHSRVHGPLELTGPGDHRELLRVGQQCVIGGPLHVDLGAPVVIGDRVHVGHQVMLLTVGHAIGPSEHRCARHVMAPIHIEDGAWLGSRVTVLGGVTIGKGAVVAAGAVVNRDVEPNTLVGGVPARLIRVLPT